MRSLTVKEKIIMARREIAYLDERIAEMGVHLSVLKKQRQYAEVQLQSCLKESTKTPGE